MENGIYYLLRGKCFLAKQSDILCQHAARLSIWTIELVVWILNGGLPCNFGSSLGLLSNLRQLSVAALVIEEISSFWCLETMQGPLSKSPLSFSLLFSIIFLGGKGSLLQ